MFGLIASGRMVQTNFEQVDLTKCVLDIPNATEINHVVLFLTGSQAFPAGFGGLIYFSLPSQGELAWYLLGHITNEKPSAIFKISNLKKSDQDSLISSAFFGQAAGGNSVHAQIGISIEPLNIIQQSTPVESSAVSTVSTFMEFSNKMLENFINYISSFSSGNSNQEYVSINVVKMWYENFQRRLQSNPYFWRS